MMGLSVVAVGGGIDHEDLAQPKPELRGAAGAADLEKRPDQERNSEDEECGEENHGASFLAVLRPACPTTTRGRFPCREDRLGEDQARADWMASSEVSPSYFSIPQWGTKI